MYQAAHFFPQKPGMIKVLKQKILWQDWGFVRTIGRAILSDQRNGPVRTFYSFKNYFRDG